MALPNPLPSILRRKKTKSRQLGLAPMDGTDTLYMEDRDGNAAVRGLYMFASLSRPLLPFFSLVYRPSVFFPFPGPAFSSFVILTPFFHFFFNTNCIHSFSISFYF